MVWKQIKFFTEGGHCVSAVVDEAECKEVLRRVAKTWKTSMPGEVLVNGTPEVHINMASVIVMTVEDAPKF